MTDIFLIFCFHIWNKSLNGLDAAGAVGVFAIFLAVSVLTEGQLGAGDAFLFAVTGFGLGLTTNIFIITLSFTLSFIAAIFLVVVRHKGKNYAIPLAPFVFASFSIYVICGCLPA